MRVNFFGGPCAGKSRTAPLIFSQLKDRGLSVELVLEFVKPMAYEGKEFKKHHQTWIYGNQMYLEYQYLVKGVKNIVTDSPAILGAVYAQSEDIRRAIHMLYREYDADFPSVNIFLERRDKEYQTEGRFQNLEGAKKVDEEIRRMLDRRGYPYETFPYHARHAILDYVLTKIDR